MASIICCFYSFSSLGCLISPITESICYSIGYVYFVSLWYFCLNESKGPLVSHTPHWLLPWAHSTVINQTEREVREVLYSLLCKSSQCKIVFWVVVFLVYDIKLCKKGKFGLTHLTIVQIARGKDWFVMWYMTYLYCCYHSHWLMLALGDNIWFFDVLCHAFTSLIQSGCWLAMDQLAVIILCPSLNTIISAYTDVHCISCLLQIKIVRVLYSDSWMIASDHLGVTSVCDNYQPVRLKHRLNGREKDNGLQSLLLLMAGSCFLMKKNSLLIEPATIYFKLLNLWICNQLYFQTSPGVQM